jgi:hypothetical protein
MDVVAPCGGAIVGLILRVQIHCREIRAFMSEASVASLFLFALDEG